MTTRRELEEAKHRAFRKKRDYVTSLFRQGANASCNEDFDEARRLVLRIAKHLEFAEQLARVLGVVDGVVIHSDVPGGHVIQGRVLKELPPARVIQGEVEDGVGVNATTGWITNERTRP